MLFDVYTDKFNGTKITRKETIDAADREIAINKYFDENELYDRIAGGYKISVVKHGLYVYSYEEASLTNDDDVYFESNVIHVVPHGADEYSMDPMKEKDGLYITMRKTHLLLYFSGLKTADQVLAKIRSLVSFCLSVNMRDMTNGQARLVLIRHILDNNGFFECSQDRQIMIFTPENMLFAESAEHDTANGTILMPEYENYRDDEGLDRKHICIADPRRVYKNTAEINADNGSWSALSLLKGPLTKEDIDAFALGDFTCNWDALLKRYKDRAEK